MKSQHSDILIIGAGIFGTSTAYHLSKTEPSRSVTVIDRTVFPPQHAASTDINKIIRQDYTSAFYMELARESMRAWETWIELKPLFHQTGWINFSEKQSDIVDRIRQNFKDRGADPTQDVDLDSLRKYFKGIYEQTDLERVQAAYWNPEAGWCDAGMATYEVMKLAIINGVKYVERDVQSLVLGENGGIKEVKTASGHSYSGDKVLLASGAWTSSLMTEIEDQLEIEGGDRIEKQITAAGVCVAHFKLNPQEIDMVSQLPVTIYMDDADMQPPPQDHHLKITNGHSFTNTVITKAGRKISVPPSQDQHEVPEKLKEETLKICRALVPQLTSGRDVTYWRLCWDSISPTQDHLITKHPHPKLNNLYFAVGGSFHSYKFLPTIGKYILNVLDGKSNGQEKDEHWAWKTLNKDIRGAHEKTYPRRELRSLYSQDAQNQINGHKHSIYWND